ncbi:MAG TPA: hypothetical protein DEV97_06600, partial [Lachnospiraceae bacterium]|nr:hypothetical protein [Lachnospiraceae bacterium]
YCDSRKPIIRNLFCRDLSLCLCYIELNCTVFHCRFPSVQPSFLRSDPSVIDSSVSSDFQPMFFV